VLKSESHEIGLEQMKEVLDRGTAFLVTVARFAAIVSPPIGIYLLLFYLRRMSAPFPATESTIATLLVISTTTFIVLFLIIAGGTIYVGFFRGLPRWVFIQEMLPSLGRITSKAPSFWESLRVLSDYVLLYGPFLFTLLTFCFLHINDTRAFLLSFAYGFGLGTPLVALSFFAFRARPYGERGTRRTLAKAKLSLQFAFSSILASLLALFWIPLAFAPIWPILSTTGTAKNDVWFLLILVFMHFTANISRRGSVQTFFGLAGVLILLAFFTFGPSVLGAMTLRALGIGGGLPAEFLIQQAEDGHQIDLEPVRGCLILMTAAQIILHRTGHKQDCNLDSSLWAESGKEVPAFASAEVYLRSDVKRISGF
jgi:hypothetical protein